MAGGAMKCLVQPHQGLAQCLTGLGQEGVLSGSLLCDLPPLNSCKVPRVGAWPAGCWLTVRPRHHEPAQSARRPSQYRPSAARITGARASHHRTLHLRTSGGNLRQNF